MASPRFYADSAHPVAYYHCITRVVGRQFLLHEEEKTELVRMIRAYENFCQVRVLAYVVMSNHFHVLAEVKGRPTAKGRPVELSDEELLAHLGGIYARPYVQGVKETLEALRAKGRKGDKEAAALKEKYLSRMWDVSQFMKELKQRYSLWYNKRTGRRGTLWEERFSSVMVEGKTQALSVISAYIDLNPVRAGLVVDPKDYPWCGYGEASNGGRKSLASLAAMASEKPWEEVPRLPASAKILANYQKWLFGEAEKPVTQKHSAAPESAGATQGAAAAKKSVGKKRGTGKKKTDKLPMNEALRQQVRYFSRGLAVGSPEFLEEYFQTHRARFNPRRKVGARPMKEADFGGLHTMRAPRVGLKESDRE